MSFDVPEIAGTMRENPTVRGVEQEVNPQLVPFGRECAAKMALDDTVKAAAIDVENDNGVITLKGSVRSEGNGPVPSSWRAKPPE